MKIAFLQAGGTIDKDYPRTISGYAFEMGEPAVVRILQKLNPVFAYEILPVLQKDSMDMTDADRQTIVDACKKAASNKIIITHGTDTLLETAKALRVVKNKAIVLTGAMKPERFSDSDAPVNVGTAIGAVNVLESGVFVAMHGRVFRWDACRRDGKTGQFVER